MRTGTANLPLHPGKCPPWLFRRMKPLAGAVTEAVVQEYGQEEFLGRLSDPFWFQAFGCVLGFDWHSSGLTTTVCGALKEGIDREATGITVCGGKGACSRKTPQEIASSGLSTSKTQALVRASRLSAKVDNTAVQDGYQLYHHVFIFSERGQWAVVQQGLNTRNRYARRYHWLSERVESFVEEPHSAICCDQGGRTLDMTAKSSRECRGVSLDLARDGPDHLTRYFQRNTLRDFFPKKQKEFDLDRGSKSVLSLPENHMILHMHQRNLKTLQDAHEIQPQNYEELLSVKGMGPKTVRALALISQVVYGKPASWKDPVKYAFAHGGKDGIPYPVDREAYDRSIETLKTGLQEARIGRGEKLGAIKRLERFL